MELFRWGVASFDPRADSVLLWTRLPPGRGGAHWELASDPNFRDPLAGGDESTSAARNHTVCVDATGLDPGTTYWYRFRVGDTWSPVGRTRTLPAAPVERFRIGYVCCSRFSVAPLGVYRAMAEREVDLVVHLGDYIYEDDEKRGPRRHRPPRPAVTLDDYRTRIGQVREDPDCQALHMRHPMTVIWDDHDLADNAWRDGAKHHDEASQGPWPPRVEAAARARQEWLPSRLLDVDQPTRTWRSVPVGDLAELVLLDTRRERDRQPGDVGALPRDDPRRTMLGAEQRAWTAERLADVGRPWTILHTGVVMSELALRLPPIAALGPLLPSGYAVIDGKVLHDDQWDGYPVERAHVSRWIRDRASTGARTLVVSGDVHSSWAFEGPTDPDAGGHSGRDAPAVALEVTVPSTTSVPMARSHPPGLWRVIDLAARDLPHVRWAELTERGYVILELDRDRAVAEWWFVDPFHRDPSGSAKRGAAFESSRDAWPPTWVPASPSADPCRPAPPVAPPPRPPDLARMRWWRRRRRALELAATTAAVLAPVAAIAGLRRRRRRC